MKARSRFSVLVGLVCFSLYPLGVLAQSPQSRGDVYTNAQCQRNQNLSQRDRFTVFYRAEFNARNQSYWFYTSRSLDGSAIFCISRPNFEQAQLLNLDSLQNNFVHNIHRDRQQNTSFIVTIREGNSPNVPITAYKLDLSSPPQTALNSLSVLQKIDTLKEGDPQLPSDGSLYHTHTFEARENQSVSINLQSRSFDHYLVVLSPDGEKIAESQGIRQDEIAKSRTSEITVNLPVSGRYQVIVNGSDRTSQGEYSLNINWN